MPEGAARLTDAGAGVGLRALSRQFAAVAAAHDRDASFQPATSRPLHQAGLLGLTVPQRYGGQGAGLAKAAEAIGIVAEGCASTALIFAMQLLKHAGFARHGVWTEALRERLGREAVEAGALVNHVASRAGPGLAPARWPAPPRPSSACPMDRRS